MEQKTEKHKLLGKLLNKERNLEINRIGMYIYLQPYQQTYQIIVMDPKDLIKLNEMEIDSAIWQLTQLKIKKTLNIRLKKKTIRKQTIYLIKKPPKFELICGSHRPYMLVTTNATIQRQIQNLQTLQNMDEQIYRFITNKNVMEIPRFPIRIENDSDLSNLNQSQKRAIRFAMQYKICLIKGPPGTGKTTTIAKLVELMMRTGLKIMVCGPSNVATDIISKAIIKDMQNISNITRFSSQRAKNKISQELSQINFNQKVMRQLLLHNMPPEYCDWFKQNLNRFINKQDLFEHHYWTNLTIQQFHKTRMYIYDKVLNETQVLACTIITSGSTILQSFFPDIMIIDQAGQATETQLIVALNKGPRKVIFIGDQIQLSPTVISNNEILKQGMFRRLMLQKKNLCILLDTQYRMHPKIANFASRQFYNNEIKSGVTEADRFSKISLFEQLPICIIDHESQQSIVETSYKNLEQVNIIANILQYFPKEEMSNVGIITGFKPQEIELRKRLQKYIVNGLEIQTFDGYQGNQKEYIIISFVRSNKQKSIGFLEEFNRANVALTRARRGLVLVGNISTMKSSNNGKYNPWKSFIQYFEELTQQLQLKLMKQAEQAKKLAQKTQKQNKKIIQAPKQVKPVQPKQKTQKKQQIKKQQKKVQTNPKIQQQKKISPPEISKNQIVLKSGNDEHKTLPKQKNGDQNENGQKKKKKKQKWEQVQLWS